MPAPIEKLNAGVVENGPLLLLVTGAAVLTYGFVAGSEFALGGGIVLIALAILLPRLHGSFKFGATGIEGNLRDQVLSKVRAEGERAKLPSARVEKAVEAAQRAVPAGAALTVGPGRLEGVITTEIDETQERIAHYIANGVLYEDLPPIRQCFSCGEIGPEPHDGKCRFCGTDLDR